MLLVRLYPLHLAPLLIWTTEVREASFPLKSYFQKFFLKKIKEDESCDTLNDSPGLFWIGHPRPPAPQAPNEPQELQVQVVVRLGLTKNKGI